MTRTSYILFDAVTGAPVLSWPARSNHVRDRSNADRAASAHADRVNAQAGRVVCFVRSVTITI